MSLRVWLPLNGSLENKGLDDITVTNNGATIDNNGKIGKCYSFVNGYLNLPSSLMSNFKECSICFWININSWNTSYETYFHAGKNFYSWTDYIFGILRNGANSTVCFTIGNGSTASNSNYLTSAWNVGEWMHVAFIYSTGKCKIYLNGNIDKEYDTSIVPDFTKITRITIGHSNGSAYQTNCKMNDFRIYDHALSPLEIKHISQGLVLHYPLNRGGFGVDNILVNTHFDSRYTQSTGWDTEKNGTQLATSWGGYNGGVSNPSTVYHAHLKEFNGEWVYEYIKTVNESWLGISQGGLNSKLIAGKTYTFSWEQYCVSGSNYVQTGLYYFKTGATSANFHLGLIYGNVGRELGKWQKFSRTFIAPEDGDYSKNMSWYIYGASGNGIVYVRHPKLEEGSIATSWSPSSLDTLATTMGLNDNVEYDTSGYENNGTKVGTFNYDSDTPKYNISTVFNGVDNCIQVGNWYNLFQNPFTINVWFKKDEIGSKGYETLFGAGGGFEIDTRAGNSQTLSLYLASTRGGTAYSPFNLSQWYMVTMVSDGTNEEFYVDGILRKTIEKKTIPNNMYRIGAWSSDTSQNFKGQMSDFRVYATALSAEDIKSLYNNSAYIDNQGNIYGAVYEEV